MHLLKPILTMLSAAVLVTGGTAWVRINRVHAAEPPACACQHTRTMLLSGEGKAGVNTTGCGPCQNRSDIQKPNGNTWARKAGVHGTLLACLDFDHDGIGHCCFAVTEIWERNRVGSDDKDSIDVPNCAAASPTKIFCGKNYVATKTHNPPPGVVIP